MISMTPPRRTGNIENSRQPNYSRHRELNIFNLLNAGLGALTSLAVPVDLIQSLKGWRRLVGHCMNFCSLSTGYRPRFPRIACLGRSGSAPPDVKADAAARQTFRALLASALLLPAGAAAALTVEQPCAGNPDALSTSRVITVEAASTPRVGRKHFPDTLPLADKEVVLTFDDGPLPGTTSAVLDALKRECVLATFFLIGRNAAAHPELARRELADGHTVAHHSFSHLLLDRVYPEHADTDINRGFAAVDKALYGDSADRPRTPFFRFPGFASSPQLLNHLAARNIVVFGADLWASDWNPMSPDQELSLVLDRLEAARGGIILFHDTKRQTAAMLPAFLRSLKMQGYKVVHVVAPAI
jgi:peptidoglycan/xylan/chitin deacetylase (PgdA/CDA1 family)